MNRQRKCKKCREKFTFDDVKSNEGDDGTTIARYVKDKRDVGIMAHGVVVCSKCLSKEFTARGIEGIDTKDLAVSRWRLPNGTMVALSWERVEPDGFSLIRVWCAREQLRGQNTEIIQNSERVTVEQLMATEQEALDAGMSEVTAAGFAKMLGQ